MNDENKNNDALNHNISHEKRPDKERHEDDKRDEDRHHDNRQDEKKPEKNKPWFLSQPVPSNSSNYLILAVCVLLSVYLSIFIQQGNTIEEIAYSTLKEEVRQSKIKDITLKGEVIFGHYFTSAPDITEGKEYDFKSVRPPIDDLDFIPLLDEYQVKLTVQSTQQSPWTSMLVAIIPWVFIIVFFYYSRRMLGNQMGGMGKSFGFSESRAKRYSQDENQVHYSDVAGLEHAKKDLMQVIEYLQNPQKFRKLGAKIPRGILLMGPPGTGKTLLAKATAGEAGVPFFSITGSDFVEMFVGVGASRVRSMFEEAKKVAPALIFIDEIDAVGRSRGTGMGGGNDEREQTLNQILAEMDGFSSNEIVIVLAATNRPDILDPALLRPGRFDRKVTLDLPQRKARIELLKVHSRAVPLAQDIDLDQLASDTVGFSGADISNYVNEAALNAASEDRTEVSLEDFIYARDKIILGAKSDRLLTEKDKTHVAIHEAGHTLSAFFLPNADPLKKVSIIPHGRALGFTEQHNDEDRVNYGQHYLEEKLIILLSGREAEKIKFGEFSSGAADDLKQATNLAQHMVSQWGMSESLGPVSFLQDEGQPFLGRDMAQQKHLSEHTAAQIDAEVAKLIKQASNDAVALIEKHNKKLDALSKALLEQETLDELQIKDILA